MRCIEWSGNARLWRPLRNSHLASPPAERGERPKAEGVWKSDYEGTWVIGRACRTPPSVTS